MKYKVLFVLLIFSLCILKYSYSQSDIVTKISESANKSLKSYLNKIPAGKEKLYGFKNRLEFNKAKIGYALRLYTLNPDFFKDAILTDKNYLIPSNEWRVPVLVEEEYESFLTISLINKVYKAVDLGGSAIAQEIQIKEKEITNVSHNSISILRIYQLHCDFIFDSSVLNEKSSICKVYPLISAEQLTNSIITKSNKETGFTIKEVLNEIKNVLKK